MSTPFEIHWHEGLFLQPQHFQFWQQQLASQFGMERSWTRAFPYGLVEMKPKPEALSQWRLEFESLKAVMPSGRVVDWPGNADLPTLDLKHLFTSNIESVIICLCVPIHYTERRNTLRADEDAATQRLLFKVREFEVTDETSGEYTRTVLAHAINAKLLPDESDKSNMEFFPILKLDRSLLEDDATPKVDPSFAGPLFSISGSAMIVDSLYQFSSMVENARETTGLLLRRSGFKIQDFRSSQLEQLVRYRALCRLNTLLPEYLAARHACSAHELFIFLATVFTEMASLYPDRVEELSCPRYDHERPGVVFRELFSKLFDIVQGSAQSSFLRVPFERTEHGYFTKLTEEHLNRPSAYYLGIRGKVEIGELNCLVEDRDRFKVMARSLAERAIFGVKLTSTPVPPMQLPAQAGLYYYQMNVSESPRMWEQITAEKEVVVRWNGFESTNYELALYLPLPS